MCITGAGLSGRQTHRTQGVFNHTEDYVLLPDERTVSLCCWDSRTAERKNLLSLGHNNIVRCIVHSPTNPGFMTCSDDFRARFWYRRTTTDWAAVRLFLSFRSGCRKGLDLQWVVYQITWSQRYQDCSCCVWTLESTIVCRGTCRGTWAFVISLCQPSERNKVVLCEAWHEFCKRQVNFLFFFYFLSMVFFMFDTFNAFFLK